MKFKAWSMWIGCYLVCGPIFIVIGLLQPMYLHIGVGVVFLIVGAYLSQVPIVWLNDDHFVLKVAPAAPKKLVLYKEIEKIDEVSAKKVFVHRTIDGSTKKIRLPMSSLSPDDRAAMLAELKKRASA